MGETTGNFLPPTVIFVGRRKAKFGVAAGAVVVACVVVPVVSPRLSVRWGNNAAASVERPSRTSITISRRRAAIGLYGGEVGRHGSLNDMAAALLDASLVVMLGVVTVSDLRKRLVPDGPLVVSLGLTRGICGILAPAELPERLAAGAGAAGFL